MSTPDRDPTTPLFTRYYDLMLWLTQRTEKFPRSQRFILASRLLDTAYACHAQLIEARKVTGTARAQALREADVLLENLRLQLRLAHDLKCISLQQYEHGARLVTEVGKMLGSWIKR